MKKKGHRPITRVKNPEPNIESPDWVIWAAWADRITFEEIEKKTGYKESDVIKIMRRSLKPSSFRLWRKRVNQKSIKHRKKFEYVLLVPVKGEDMKITFDDWIFKQDDRVAINRATMTKFGIKVAELTVVFVKD